MVNFILFYVKNIDIYLSAAMYSGFPLTVRDRCQQAVKLVPLTVAEARISYPEDGGGMYDSRKLTQCFSTGWSLEIFSNK